MTHGDGKENGFYYVDLGLPSGTMWATCNVGASTATDEGLLFQFGRVDGYRYGDENNQFRTQTQNAQDTGNSYIPLTTSGKTYDVGSDLVPGDDILDPEDDAAHVNMEGAWRMPKENELNELFDNTEKSVVTVNGVKGMLFTSNKNGHKLFIPFVQGSWDIDSSSFRSDNWSFANVWSSQVHSFNVDNAYDLHCYSISSSSSGANVNNSYRTHALSARGVFKK